MQKTIRIVLTGLLFFVCLTVTGAGARAQAGATAPRVAVLFESGFPYYGVLPVPLPEIVQELRETGVRAELLSVRALYDTTRFNARTYAALIVPYGNTYPVEAFPAMRAFHEGGGCLIVTGIPFTHSVERDANGEWHDLGHHDNPARFGPDGIGVGGFAGPGMTSKPEVAPDDPLGLAPLALDWSSDANSQWLNPASLPAGDLLIPALGSAQQPVIAIVVHHTAPFEGAVDVWTHRGPENDMGPWVTEQLLLRGTVAALERKGLLTGEQRQAAFARFARIPRPRTYANLVLPVVPRPYSTLQPKMPPPARHLYVADVRHCTPAERILLLSLQGLVNRTQPRIYLIQKDTDPFWLTEMQRQGATGAPIAVTAPLSLVQRFRTAVHGAVVPDPKIYLTPCVAACLAGTDSLLMATPELAKRLQLPIKADLRGKFKSDSDALHYIHTALLRRLNPYLACCLDPAIFDSGALDQIIAAKGIVFWITGAGAQQLPGANGFQELDEVKSILAAMPLGAVVRGFWWHGENIGINEGPGVSLASRFGKITVVSDYVANFSVFSGVPTPTLKQKPQAPPPPLDSSKVYFSFTVSDGDNLCTWRDYFLTYFRDPLHGTFPVGWGMGPTIIDCSPVWARWYYDHSTPNDEFLCDVSGVGYIYGPDWAASLKDRDGAFADFYRLTEQYMHRLDMHTVRLMNVDAPDIAKAASLMPDVRFLMPDYGSGGGKSYGELTYDLPGDQTVFRAITGADGGAEKLVNQIRDRIGTTRPAFINVFIWNWGSKLSDMKRIIDLLGPEYVPVTPSQLHALYKQAHPEGTAAATTP